MSKSKTKSKPKTGGTGKHGTKAGTPTHRYLDREDVPPPPAATGPRPAYSATIRVWTDAWAEFVPFLAFDTHIRTVISTTNAIESVNARIRRAVNARGHFPDEQAALKCVYPAVMSLDPTGQGQCPALAGRVQCPALAGRVQCPGGQVKAL